MPPNPAAVIEWNDLTHAILFLLEVIFVVVAVVKVVGKIETTTALLKQALEHLRDSIDQLSTTVEKLDDRTADHRDRIIKLETELKDTQRHQIAR